MAHMQSLQNLQKYQEYILENMNKYGFAEQTIFIADSRCGDDLDAQLTFLQKHATKETYQKFLTHFENLYGVNLEEDNDD
ncbi:hypothetical protein AAEX37_01075 [Oligella sp. MSHR50489EDL]|uniref:hypothetical protein n=1 Tax=Oligella sp. MSHR50489EDL TaxID=3139409 RepID=UPI003D81B675